MADSQSVFVGVDLGSSRAKVAIINEKKQLIGYALEKSGLNFDATARSCLNQALKMAGRGRDNIGEIVSSGYGRRNVSFAGQTKTEISCHARGCYYHFPEEMTIIDIGSQDNKIIKTDKLGQRTSFKMNRKCAAGTGAFLEEIAHFLEIDLDRLDRLARQSTKVIELGSFCTVFSKTEVLERIREGEKIEDIVRALFLSVIKRIVEMDNLSHQVVMVGGVVAHNPYLVGMMEAFIGREILVPELPQYTGALGAALFAHDQASKEPDGP